MLDAPVTRVGVLRPPHASMRPTVAEIEARVLRTEVARRIGPVVLDLRSDGPIVGPWLPNAHAAWPGGVDAVLDATPLWATGTPLTALAGRTIDPVAAEVRARMLRHLGLIPVESYVFDAARLNDLLALHVSPTDLWLVARHAASVSTGDLDVDGLATGAGDGHAALDAALDLACGGVEPADPAVAGLVADLADLRSEVTRLGDELVRVRADAADRIDALTAERSVLLERLERTELDRVR